MLRYLLLVSVCVMFAAPALGQRKANLQEFKSSSSDDDSPPADTKEARRKAATGMGDLKNFGAAREPPPKPFPLLAVLLGVLVAGALVPVGMKMYKSTHKELEDLSTFGMSKGARLKETESEQAPSLSRRPPSRALGAKKENVSETRVLEAEEAGTSRDLVWDAVSQAGQWVTTDWVASKAGLSSNEAADEIGALVEEGYLQEARDSKGKPVFRAA
jgi:hypothetical protein